jgi:hypothetical protein
MVGSARPSGRARGGDAMRKALLAATAVLALASPAAHAETNETLTLVCQGTSYSRIGGKNQPMLERAPFGLVLNLTSKTAEGFPVEDLPVKIDASQATIQFGGAENWGSEFRRRFWGTIDRVTGETQATFEIGTSTDQSTENFSLKCKPAQRMF